MSERIKGSLSVYHSAELQESCRVIKAAAAEHHYPLVLSSSQMARIERALSLAIEDAIQAMSDEPDCHHEIQPHIDGFNQIYTLLKLARAANKGGHANENWRGVEL